MFVGSRPDVFTPLPVCSSLVFSLWMCLSFPLVQQPRSFFFLTSCLQLSFHMCVFCELCPCCSADNFVSIYLAFSEKGRGMKRWVEEDREKKSVSCVVSDDTILGYSDPKDMHNSHPSTCSLSIQFKALCEWEKLFCITKEMTKDKTEQVQKTVINGQEKKYLKLKHLKKCI